MQDISPVQSLVKPPGARAQSREDKIAILRRAGYASDRLDAIETEGAPPPVLHDPIIDDMTGDDEGDCAESTSPDPHSSNTGDPRLTSLV